MSVEFLDENSLDQSNRNVPQGDASGIIGFLINKGIVKSQIQAQAVLIAVIVVCLIVAVVVAVQSFSSKGAQIIAPPGKTIVYPTNAPPRLEQP